MSAGQRNVRVRIGELAVSHWWSCCTPPVTPVSCGECMDRYAYRYDLTVSGVTGSGYYCSLINRTIRVVKSPAQYCDWDRIRYIGAGCSDFGYCEVYIKLSLSFAPPPDDEKLCFKVEIIDYAGGLGGRIAESALFYFHIAPVGECPSDDFSDGPFYPVSTTKDPDPLYCCGCDMSAVQLEITAVPE